MNVKKLIQQKQKRLNNLVTYNHISQETANEQVRIYAKRVESKLGD